MDSLRTPNSGQINTGPMEKQELAGWPALVGISRSSMFGANFSVHFRADRMAGAVNEIIAVSSFLM